MIRIGQRIIGAVMLGPRVITAAYKGARLVWSAIRSCFGSGVWYNDRPWSNTDAWKNQ